MEEIWKIIPSYPNYEASSLGRIRRKKTKRPIKIRYEGLNHYGRVWLHTDKKRYIRKVGRLVWEAFNGCPCEQTIDHIDRNKINDKINNLRCISMAENLKNRDIYKGKNKYNLTEEIKMEIAKNYREGIWSLNDIENKYKIPVNYLSVVLNRGSWDKIWKKNNIENT